MSYRPLYKDMSSSFLMTVSAIRLPLFLGIVGAMLGIGYLVLPWYVFLLLLVSSLLVAATFMRPEIGYYIVLLLLPVDMTQIYIKLKGTDYVFMIFPYVIPLIVTVLAWTAFVMAGKRTKGQPFALNNVLLILIFYELATMIWSPVYSMALLLGASLILHFIFLHLTLSLIKDKQALQRMINVLIAMGMILASGVIISQWESYKETIHFTNNTGIVIMFGEFHNRPAGFGTVDNMGGLLSILSFIVLGKALIQKKRAMMALNFAILAYFVVAMILTVSRGALVGFVAGLSIFIVINPLTRSKAIRNTVISILLLILTIFIAKPAFIDRILIGFGYTGTLYFSEKSSFSSNYDESEEGISGMDQRKYWWETALNEMINNPSKLIIGLGIGGFIQYAGTIGTHSVPLSFFYDMGLIGLIVYIVFVCILIMELYYYYKNAPETYSYYMYIAALVAFVAEVGVHGLIDYDFFSYTARMFWFPLAYVFAVLNVVKGENVNLGRIRHV